MRPAQLVGDMIFEFEYTTEYCLELLKKFPEKRFLKNVSAYIEHEKAEIVKIVMCKGIYNVINGTWIGDINGINYYLEVIK